MRTYHLFTLGNRELELEAAARARQGEHSAGAATGRLTLVSARTSVARVVEVAEVVIVVEESMAARFIGGCPGSICVATCVAVAPCLLGH